MQQDLKSNAWDYADFWKNFREPARPNPSEIEILAPHINSQTNVLILGSTPEYRDLCATKNAKVTVVDYDKATYQSLSKLMKQSSRQETFIHSNWLNVNLAPEYDLILGDHVINLITKDQLPQLFQNVHNALKDEHSRWMTRIITLEGLKKQTLEDILKNYRQHYQHQDFFSCTTYDIYHQYLEKDYSVSLGNVWNQLHASYLDGIMFADEFAVYDQLGIKNSAGKGFFYPKTEIEGLLFQYFVNKGNVRGDLYYNEQTYFYLLQKNDALSKYIEL